MVVTIIFIVTISLHDAKMLYSDDTTILVTDTGGEAIRTVVYFSMVPVYSAVVGQRDTLRKNAYFEGKTIQEYTHVRQRVNTAVPSG